MDFSNEVLQGLNCLANTSYISEDNFKKIVNSALGLLAGEQNIERVSNICPEKSDVIKQIYVSLLTFTIEVLRNKSEEEIQSFLGKHNFKGDRIDYYLKVLNLNRENIVRSIENCSSGWPCIVDADWRLDYILKSNVENHTKGPLYYIVLTTEKNGTLDYVKFTCNLHQLQDLSTKLKEIMDESWNFWDVKSPPVCTVRTALHFKEINSLNEVTFDALKTLRDLNYFDREAAILSRFLYKYKRIFRQEKGIHNLVKVNHCLKRYLKLDMSGVLFTFKQSLPFKFNQKNTYAYLPTQQMLKWVLLRLLAFSRLFVRVIELTKEAGAYLYKKLFLGWGLNLSLLVFSVTARILATSKYIVAKSIEWYSAFYKLLPYLQQTSDFLPNYNFPTDLKLWLGKTDLAPLQKKTFFDKIFEVIDLVQTDEENDGDDDIEVKIVNKKLLKTLFKMDVSNIDSDIEEIIVEKTKEGKKELKRPLTSEKYEDLGVPVDDDETAIKTSCKKIKKMNERKRLKWLKKVKKNSSNL